MIDLNLEKKTSSYFLSENGLKLENRTLVMKCMILKIENITLINHLRKIKQNGIKLLNHDCFILHERLEKMLFLCTRTEIQKMGNIPILFEK